MKDLREARQAKSRDGLQKVDDSELSVGGVACLFVCMCADGVTASEPVLYGDQRDPTDLCAGDECDESAGVGRR